MTKHKPKQKPSPSEQDLRNLFKLFSDYLIGVVGESSLDSTELTVKTHACRELILSKMLHMIGSIEIFETKMKESRREFSSQPVDIWAMCMAVQVIPSVDNINPLEHMLGNTNRSVNAH